MENQYDPNNMNNNGANFTNDAPNNSRPNPNAQYTPNGQRYAPGAVPQSSGFDCKDQATASLALGIIGVLCWFMGWSSILSVILGVVGLIFAGKAKSAGYESSIRTAGFVLSLISLIGGALVFIACLACVGSLAAVASSGALH